MGNRAVITTQLKEKNEIGNQTGVYIHWNGGRDSVEGFLKYCELKGYRKPENDSYGMARLIQVISNYFGGGNSVDVGASENLDCENFDNGVYFIKDWKIVGRLHEPKVEQLEYSLIEVVKAIDEKQPKDEQLGNEAIDKALKTAYQYTYSIAVGDIEAKDENEALEQLKENISNGLYEVELVETN